MKISYWFCRLDYKTKKCVPIFHFENIEEANKLKHKTKLPEYEIIPQVEY